MVSLLDVKETPLSQIKRSLRKGAEVKFMTRDRCFALLVAGEILDEFNDIEVAILRAKGALYCIRLKIAKD